jgi:acyl-CoA synthetase (NDP forming)
VEAAVRALARVVEYAVWLHAPDGPAADAGEVDVPAAKKLVKRVPRSAEGEVGDREIELDQSLVTELLGHYGIDLWPTRPVADAEAAVAAGEALGWDVVLKSTLDSLRERPDQTHVWRNISDAEDMRDAWETLTQLIDPAMGRFVVQRSAPPGVPVAIRSFEDPLFGPVVSFGISGPVIELLGDWSYRIPPLGQHEVASMVREVKSSPLLFGYRGADAVDVAAVEDLITRVAALKNDLPNVSSLELTLVLAGVDGAQTLTATARVATIKDPRPDSLVRRMPDLESTIPD